MTRIWCIKERVLKETELTQSNQLIAASSGPSDATTPALGRAPQLSWTQCYHNTGLGTCTTAQLHPPDPVMPLFRPWDVRRSSAKCITTSEPRLGNGRIITDIEEKSRAAVERLGVQ
jgi:hypothetical protein